jgi:hypothetical protein
MLSGPEPKVSAKTGGSMLRSRPWKSWQLLFLPHMQLQSRREATGSRLTLRRRLLLVFRSSGLLLSYGLVFLSSSAHRTFDWA